MAILFLRKSIQNIGLIIGVTRILFGILVFIGKQIISKRVAIDDSNPKSKNHYFAL